MSTRSCVAIPTADGGWKGRYVHFDGYPEHMLPALNDLISRKGLDRVIDVLINWNPGWASIGLPDAVFASTLGGTSHNVSDYGVAYHRTAMSMDGWITSEDPDPVFIEYVYILEPTGIRVLESYQTEAGEFSHRPLTVEV